MGKERKPAGSIFYICFSSCHFMLTLLNKFHSPQLSVLRLPQPFKPKALASLHHTETCIPVQILTLSYLQPYSKRSCNPAHLGTLCYHFNTWVTQVEAFTLGYSAKLNLKTAKSEHHLLMNAAVVCKAKRCPTSQTKR